MGAAAKKAEPANTFAARKAKLQRQASDVCAGQDRAERIIQRHVAMLKESFKDLPIQNLEITARGFDACSCRVALRILDEQASAVALEERQAGG